MTTVSGCFCCRYLSRCLPRVWIAFLLLLVSSSFPHTPQFPHFYPRFCFLHMILGLDLSPIQSPAFFQPLLRRGVSTEGPLGLLLARTSSAPPGISLKSVSTGTTFSLGHFRISAVLLREPAHRKSASIRIESDKIFAPNTHKQLRSKEDSERATCRKPMTITRE